MPPFVFRNNICCIVYFGAGCSIVGGQNISCFHPGLGNQSILYPVGSVGDTFAGDRDGCCVLERNGIIMSRPHYLAVRRQLTLSWTSVSSFILCASLCWISVCCFILRASLILLTNLLCVHPLFTIPCSFFSFICLCLSILVSLPSHEYLFILDHCVQFSNTICLFRSLCVNLHYFS